MTPAHKPVHKWLLLLAQWSMPAQATRLHPSHGMGGMESLFLEKDFSGLHSALGSSCLAHLLQPGTQTTRTVLEEHELHLFLPLPRSLLFEKSNPWVAKTCTALALASLGIPLFTVLSSFPVPQPYQLPQRALSWCWEALGPVDSAPSPLPSLFQESLNCTRILQGAE